ncbi:unnamed protein product [Closterium sp. Naga37s-1]|nr:unnamed protein product [Closterium sp. Naga37s-1]
MAQPGNAAAARVSPLTQQQQPQQQQHSFDRRDRRAQSLESQRKRDRASGFDLDASSESRAAKSARTGACASSQPSSSSTRPSSSQSSPSSSFPSASLSSRAVDMGGEEWRGVSEEAKGLVRCLLQRDPRKRSPAGKIMTHPWILLNCLGGRILRQQLAKKPTAAGAPASAAVAGAGASAHAALPLPFQSNPAPLPHHGSSPAFQPDSSA